MKQTAGQPGGFRPDPPCFLFIYRDVKGQDMPFTHSKNNRLLILQALLILVLLIGLAIEGGSI